MNLSALNGEALNGTAVTPLSASAAITGIGDVSAVATRVLLASAAVSGTASLSATPQFIAGGSATVDPFALISMAPVLTQGASADAGGTVDIRVAVYNKVAGSALFDCYSGFQIIPASTLGAANVTPTATITAAATKIQPGTADALGSVTLAGTGKVTRYVSAAITGAAYIRPEAQQNRIVDGFVAITGTVDIALPDSGIVYRYGGAPIYLGDGAFTAVPTYIQASSALVDNYCVIDVLAQVMSIPFSRPIMYADFTAQATRVLVPTAALPLFGSMTASAVQRHAAQASIDGAADLGNYSTVVQQGAAQIVATASLAAAGTPVRGSLVDISGAADMAADGACLSLATANIVQTSDVTANATRVCLATVDGVVTPGFVAYANALYNTSSTVDASAGIVAFALASIQSRALLDVYVDMDAAAVVIKVPRAYLDLHLDILADGRLNIEAYDPPERTMYRAPRAAEIVRPFIDKEMRRAA